MSTRSIACSLYLQLRAPCPWRMAISMDLVTSPFALVSGNLTLDSISHKAASSTMLCFALVGTVDSDVFDMFLPLDPDHIANKDTPLSLK